jgi:hypothetical protein
MFSNNVSLAVVIHGNNGEHPAREFVSPIDRQTYVEGREGSNFTLRLRNSNAFRVLAIPSVDGLSVLDGKPAGETSPGYILEANETLDIPGWVVDEGTAAKFFFSGLKADGGDESYAAASGNDTRNKGWIGLKVFRELAVYSNAYRARGFAPAGAALLSRSFTKGMASPRVSSSITDHSFSDNMAVGSAAVMPTSNSISAMGGAASLTASANAHEGTASMDWMEQSQERGIAPQVTQTLGTGFGDATDFATQKVDFKRGDLLAMMAIKYDDRRGLKKRGIEVDRPVVEQGSAFPADKTGCAPPANWKR